MERRTEDLIDRNVATQADDEDIDFGGTHRVGTLQDTSREEITRHFGEPEGPFGKVTDHWQVRFPDGTVATIYDYNRSNRMIPDDEPTDWSIGGRNEEAVELLDLLGLNVTTCTTPALA